MIQPKLNSYNLKNVKLLQYQLNATVGFLKSTTENGISKDKGTQKAIDRNLLESFIYINSIRLLTSTSRLNPKEEAEFCKCYHALLDTLSNIPLTNDIRKKSYTFAKNKTYTLYDKDVDIKKDRTIELYELPDGALLSRLTPSLGIEYENSVSKKDYENTLDDTFSDKITKKALLIGTRISILTTLLEFLILLFTHHLNIAYTVLVLITSLPGNQHLLQLHHA